MFPGLAMAESERYLPLLVDKVERICEENGLRNDSIVMRMTGCPNGCARPYVAEVAFVGKAPGTYAMLLGGGYYGQRLNKIYRGMFFFKHIVFLDETNIPVRIRNGTRDSCNSPTDD